jgi:asparagine synthase (glutamine-hydrolysing)
MCGIVGVVDPDAVDGSVEAMCASLAHRGPDDAGVRSWADHGVTLGHRRLSIIDLSPAGRNPMPNEDGSVWVVHNGEIYNHAELRRELERLGHRFRSSCDTEVIVHAYEEWDDDHVHRLRGMFAYAIYDRRPDRARVVLFRDRLGIKPLHYAVDGERFAFASELKAFAPLAWVDRRPDVQALAEYLTYQYVPSPATAFLGVRKLEPGHLLRFERGRLELERYWDVSTDRDSTDADAAVERIRHLLADAVDDHLVADVPIGVLLSGGIDSSAVAAEAARATEEATSAYSIGFDVAEHSEIVAAAQVASHLGIRHITATVGVDDVRHVLDAQTSLHDEPFADGSTVPTRRLAELAREEVKVALSGDGGDEVFAGYRWYARWLQGRRALRLPAAIRRLAVAPFGLVPGEGRVARLTSLGGDELTWYASLIELFPPERKARVLAPELVRHLAGTDPYRHLRRFWRPDLDPLTRVQYLDLKTYLPDDILTKVDRSSMAVGLEVRPPLLDHRLVEGVFSTPASIRVDGGPKGLLKRAVGPRLPRGILDRPKKGFSAPWGSWLPRFQSWADDELRDGAAVQAGILAPDAVDGVGDRSAGARTWSLLVLERWARAHL